MSSELKNIYIATLLLTFTCYLVQSENFEVIFEWNIINYTWPGPITYGHAIRTKAYVPENNFIGGMKVYKDKMYFCIPNAKGGAPITLVSMDLENSVKQNQLLKPFPSWKMNKKGECSSLQVVQSVEIDTNGIMWVIDGFRNTPDSSKCPPKLVLLDLNRAGKVIHTYTFPQEICLQNGGFLNDIVIDESNGGYAYITDNSNIDPGLIIYSRKRNKSWKIRDSTMFAELDASNFTIYGEPFNGLSPIDGIALSEKPKSSQSDRKVYYSALVGFNLHSISTKILQDEETCKAGKWRQEVKLEGSSKDRRDGLTIDSRGNLYSALYATSGIGKWNTKEPFDTYKVIYKNDKLMIWPDTFAFDNKGNLFVLSDSIYKLMIPTIKLKVSTEILFRVFKLHTGTKSYMYCN